MNIKEYILNDQPVLSKILENSKAKGHFPQALLLNCEPEMPSLEIAKFIAKSIFCESDELVCDNCSSCKKINQNDFLNLIIIDGEDEFINKGSMTSLIDRFSKGTADELSKYVYIINIMENTLTNTLNTILKFLEEPSLNVHAIITTKNIAKILPTIVSRCEVINLMPLSKEPVINEAVKIGVDPEDAEILSFLYLNEEDIKNAAKPNYFQYIKENTKIYLETLVTNKKEARFILESKLIDSIKADAQAKLFLDLLIIFLKESINFKFNLPLTLKSNEKLLENVYNNFNNIDESIFEISELRNNIALNINKTLIIERLHTILTR